MWTLIYSHNHLLSELVLNELRHTGTIHIKAILALMKVVCFFRSATTFPGYISVHLGVSLWWAQYTWLMYPLEFLWSEVWKCCINSVIINFLFKPLAEVKLVFLIGCYRTIQLHSLSVTVFVLWRRATGSQVEENSSNVITSLTKPSNTAHTITPVVFNHHPTTIWSITYPLWMAYLK